MEHLSDFLPPDWSYMHLRDIYNYELIDITDTMKYFELERKIKGKFNLGVERTMRVQNPYLYGQFLLRKADYERKGSVIVRELFHDTAESKVASIISHNLDWRLSNRTKYGVGVSFSPSPAYANRESSRTNGSARAMIIADVLELNVENVQSCVVLPTGINDTTIGNCNQVHVKYYDDEFYPKYVIYYTNNPQLRHGYRRRW